MNTGVISVRYARALLKSADAQNAKDEVYADMQCLIQSFLNVQQLRTAIDNPMLPKENKIKLLITACGGNPSGQIKAFISLVLKEGREDLILFMAHSYVTLYRQEKNIVKGRLITAVNVASETETKMRDMIEKYANATVDLHTEVNPELIGGFILEYDTYRLDASIQSQLRTILKELK